MKKTLNNINEDFMFYCLKNYLKNKEIISKYKIDISDLEYQLNHSNTGKSFVEIHSDFRTGKAFRHPNEENILKEIMFIEQSIEFLENQIDLVDMFLEEVKKTQEALTELIILKYIHRLSLSKIGDEVGLSFNGVKKRINSCVKKIIKK